MDEKVLIQSEKYNTKKLMFIFIIIGFLLIAIGLIGLIIFIDYDESYSIVSILLYTFGNLIIIIGICIHILLSSYKLTVTNKRVYGVIKLNKRVDLPIDSISSVSVTPRSKGCSISTSSGNINFWGMKNYQNIYECLSQLLIERQEKNNVNQNHYSDAAEEIIKYKKLLDEGILTKEEFENKKKDILK